jgi:hypothetical protein
MKTTMRGLLKAVLCGLFLGSLLANWVSFKCWSIYEAKWDEVVDTARFNDLGATGSAWVLVVYDLNDD